MSELAEAGIVHSDALFIDGEWTRPSSSSMIDVIDPATEQVYHSVADAQVSDIDRAVSAAREAFDRGPWPRLSHADRAAYLAAMSIGLAARAEQIADIWTGEVGIVRALSGAIAPQGGKVFDYYASLADRFAFEERHQPVAGGDGRLVREPVGVVAAIIAWNSPVTLMAYKVAPALLAGCTVILKSAPEAPALGYILAEVAEAVGLPKGVLNILTAGPAASERLVSSEGVDKIAFTGSNAVGRRIASICGERMARFTLELGGKSAAVILDDYDVETAARLLAQYTPRMSGQVCAALTRVIVPRALHDDLVEAMVAEFAKIRVGDPRDPSSAMGPLSMARQRERVEDYVAIGRAEGARLVSGGGRPAHLSQGYYFEPTLFASVDNSMRVAREEIFGPVVTIIPADDERAAIDIANDSPFGLNGTVFTNDRERAYRVARGMRTGTIGHNGFRPDFSIAFGGFKQSGVGREGGEEGLRSYLETKTIILEDAAPNA